MNVSNKCDCDNYLIFLHIPKTAGTTFAQILQRRYQNGGLERLNSEGAISADESLKILSDARKAEIKAVTGHINFGGHRHLPKPAQYITFVRHPVDRIISHYYHVLRNPQHYLHEKVCSTGMDLETYAASGLTPELENDQTRMIAGLGDYASDQEMLETAYRNIERHFSCVGVTERFAESLVLMARLQGWSVPYYCDENIGGNKPRSLTISPEAIAAIEERNQCDMELYRFAQQQLNEQLAEYVPNWMAQTERFLWRNRQYGHMMHASSIARKGIGAGVRLLKTQIGSQPMLKPQSTMNTLL